MTAPTDRAPMFKMLAVFVGTMLAANLAVLAIEYFLPDLTMPNSIGVFFLVAAAMASGQVGGQTLKRRLTAGEKATFAVGATVLSMLLVLALLSAALAYVGLPVTLEHMVFAMTGSFATAADIADILPLVGLIMAGVSLFVCYISVGWGARTQVKALERQAAKKAI